MRQLCLRVSIITLVFASIAASVGADSKKRPALDYAFVFEGSRIHTFHITMTAEDWRKMQPEPKGPGRARPPGPPFGQQDFTYVPATVRFGDEVYRDVGLRFKGHSSFGGSAYDPLRRPYKMDFDRFVEGQTFHGFKKLNFSTAFKDPSLLREKLAYDLFARAGLPAPRAAFAKLYITVEGEFENQYAGLYTMVEQVGGRFVRHHFGESKGLLIKCEAPGDLPYRGDDWSAYERDFELKEGKKRQTRAFIEFLKFIHTASDEEFTSGIEKLLNVEGFLTYVAVNALLSNLDSYLGTGHNFYLYLNPATKRWEIIPWDLNEAFGNFQMGSPEQMVDLDIHRPYAGKRVLIERILKIPKWRERYRAIVRRLVEGPFDPDTMYAEIERLHSLIREAALADRRKPYSNQDFERSVDENIRAGLWPARRALAGRPGGQVAGDEGPPPFGEPGQAPRPPGPVQPPFDQPRPGPEGPGGGRPEGLLPPPGGGPGPLPPGEFGPPGQVVIGLKPFVRARVESVREQLAFKRRGYMIFDRGGPGPMPGGFPPGPPPPFAPGQAPEPPF